MAEQIHDGPCWCPKAADEASGDACQCCGAAAGEPCTHPAEEGAPYEMALSLTANEMLALGYATGAGYRQAKRRGDVGIAASLLSLSVKVHKANAR